MSRNFIDIQMSGSSKNDLDEIFEILPNLEDNMLRYKYKENMAGVSFCSVDFSLLKVNDEISFVQEPTNTYDSKAIAIYHNDNKIGYTFKGQIQDMCNNWIKKANIIKGYILSIDEDNNRISYIIGFYKPLSTYENMKIPLTKTSKRIDEYSNRADNLSCCDSGDEVDFEYDYDTETYIVYNDCYEEIGEISKSVSEKLQEKKDEQYDFVGIIDEIYYDDNDKPKAKIIVYFIK